MAVIRLSELPMSVPTSVDELRPAIAWKLGYHSAVHFAECRNRN